LEPYTGWTALRFILLLTGVFTQLALVYGAKSPMISSTKCVEFDVNALMDPFCIGTIARLNLMAPSIAFSVAARARVERIETAEILVM